MSFLGSLTKFSPSARVVKLICNYYPPLMGAGIRAETLSQDFRYAKVVMPLSWYNRNYVGVHFGGSLYAMTDPWYMLLLMNCLGKDFVVWDKGASINYKTPGRGQVSAEFLVTEDLIQSLRSLKSEEKRIFDLPVEVKDEGGNVVAEVTKTLYVKRKGQQLVDKPALTSTASVR